MDAAPHQTPVGIDVDLGHAELGGLGKLIVINALGAVYLAASSIDAGDLFLRNRAGTVHHQREIRQLTLNLGQHIKMQALGAGELEGAVAGADGASEAIHARALDKFLGLIWIRQLGVRLADRHVLFHAAELAEFGFHHQSLGVGRVRNALANLDVLLEWLGAGVNHHRAVKAAGDAIHAGLLVAMVEMHGENRLREKFVGTADDALQHHLVGVGTSALADLDDEGGLAVNIAPEQPHALLQVVDVIRANRVVAIGGFEQILGGDNHRDSLRFMIFQNDKHGENSAMGVAMRTKLGYYNT
jgi:hypothetical protein